MKKKVPVVLFVSVAFVIVGLFSLRANALPACQDPTSAHFKVDTLIKASSSPPSALYAGTATDSGPIGMAIAPDGSVFIPLIGSGRLMVYRPLTDTAIHVGDVPSVRVNGEIGFNGIALDLSYPKTHWIYTLFVDKDTTHVTELVNGTLTSVAMYSVNLERYTVDSTLAAGSQLTNPKLILSYKRETTITAHMAGGLSMNQDGTLVFGTGEGSNYNAVQANAGYGPMYWPFPTEDSQRSSSNTYDLRGKILRIKPIAFPDNTTPDTGVGNTYTIPTGNFRQLLSSASSPTSIIPGWDSTDDSTKIRPEIYDFGARVPIHARVDPRSGWIFWGDVGPNAPSTSATRGPAGHDEWNLATTSGFFGYPYCNGYNSAYNALTSTSPNNGNVASSGTYGHPYDCNNAVGSGSLAPMVNLSPNNTGIHHMPPALPSAAAYAGTGSNGNSNSTDDDVRFNAVYTTTGTPDHVVSSAFGGPMYRYDPGLPSTTKFPAYYEGKILYFDFIRQNLRIIKMNPDGTLPSGAAGVEDFPSGLLPQGSYTDMQYGPEGALYVLRYSTQYVPSQSIGTGGGLYRIDYTGSYDDSCYTPFVATVGPSGAASVPNVPTGVTAVALSSQDSVSWAAPSTNGGAAITSYTATSQQDTSKHCTTLNGTTTHCTVTGLIGGTSHAFKVAATNSVGTSNFSAASAFATSQTVPNAPTIVSVTRGNAQVTVLWNTPGNGGASITNYTATSNPGGNTCSPVDGTDTTCIVTGLSNGTSYTFTVTATNSVGTSSASGSSSVVTPATVPGAPATASATAGNAQVTVLWTTPSSGGSAITNYTATSNPGGKTCSPVDGTDTTCVITGLTNNTSYTFTVTATNGLGTGAASLASSAVTPNPPAGIPDVPTSVTGISGNAQVAVSWTTPASSGGSAISSYTATSNPDTRTCSPFNPVIPVQAGNKYTLTMGSMGFKSTPNFSGRITSLQYAGNEVLDQDSTTLTNGNPTNYGSTFWPSPQKYWTSACRTASNSSCFPPLSALDDNTDSATVTSDSTIAYSTPTGDAFTNLRFRKAQWANLVDSSFNIRYTMINTSSSSPDTFAPWEDTRIPAGGLYLFPSGQDATTGTLASLTKDSLGVTWFKYDSTTVPTSGTNKFYRDGVSGWFAHIDKNRVLFIKKFQDSPLSEKAPSPEDEIELYASSDRKIVEMEVQGPFNPIAGSDSVTWDMKWYVRKIPDTMTVAVGNAAIVSYINQIISSQYATPSTHCTVSGLKNGTPYTFTVAATNASGGTSAASNPSASVTPAAAPGAPSISGTTAGNAQVTVSWTAPGSNGGSAITGYTVLATPGSATCTGNGSATSCTVTSLTNGTSYTFAVTATNNVGTSAASSASSSVTPFTVPDAPTISGATAGLLQATVSWNPPASNGGSPITGYTVTSSPGSATCTSSGTSCTVNSLIGGTPYTFTVTATNLAGTGAASSPSSSVTPTSAGSSENYSSWTYKADMLLNTTSSALGVGGLGKIPVLVRLTSKHLSVFQQSQAATGQADGRDVRFSKTDGTHLPYQIDRWKFQAGDTSAAIWVLMDTLVGNSLTSLRMYWGMNTATDSSNGNAVFDTGNGFKSVWHLGDSSSTNSRTNSVVGGPAAKPNNFPAGYVPKPGVIGLADTLRGGKGVGTTLGTFFRIADTTTSDTNYYSNFSTGLTYSVWTSMRATSGNVLNTYVRWFSAAGATSVSAPPGDLAFGRNNGTSELRTGILASNGTTTIGTPNSTVTSTLDTSSGTWQFLTFTIGTGSTPSIGMYWNGVSLALSGNTGNAAVPVMARRRAYIGKTSWQDSCFKGLVDEAVLSKVARSSDWIRLNYYNQKPNVTPLFSLAYPQASPTYLKNTAIATDSPTVMGAATRFAISGTSVTDSTSFKNVTGLNFSAVTGKIYGTPTATLSAAAYAVTAYGDSSWSTTASVSITVSSTPVLATQLHDTAVNAGVAAKFGVTVTSGLGPYVYKWARTRNGVTDTVTGSTGGVSTALLTDSLSIPSPAATDSGSYKVVISNSNGSVVSNSAKLTVHMPSAPVITTQPHDTTAVSGLGMSFTVAATGNGSLSYQWKKNGNAISGATGTTFSIPSVAITDTGSYTAMITDSLGNAAAATTSNSARLSVNTAGAPVITIQPHDSTAISGLGASFSVAATGNGTLSYQWKKNGSTISGATAATFSIPSVAITDTGSYVVTVTDSLGNTSAATTGNAARLSVNIASAPVIGTQPHDTSTVSGSAASFSVAATGNGTLTYLWRKNGGNISGAVSATYSIPSVAVTDTGSYSVVVTDSLGNTGASTTSNAAHLSVNTTTAPVITTQPHDTTVMLGAAAKFSVVATGNGTLSYQWKKNGNALSGATSASYSIVVAAVIDTGSYTVVVTDSLGNTGATTTSGTARLLVSVASAPAISGQPHDTTVTSGVAAHFSVAATGNGTLSYQWMKNGVVISGATIATYSIPTVALTDTGSYTVTVTDSLGSTGATTVSSAARLSVNIASIPVITTQPRDTTVTSGSGAAFLVAATGNGTLKYQWYKNSVAVSGAVGATNSIPTAAITDTGSYTAVVTDSLGNTGASATSNAARLSVNIASAPVITTPPHDTAVNSGSGASFSVAATGNGALSYQWKNGSSNIFGATSGTYSITSAAITDTGSYSVVVTDSLGNTSNITTSTSGKLTVNIASAPVITTPPHDTAVNSGSGASFSVAATGNGALSYQWKKGGSNISGATSGTYSIASAAITDTGSYSVVVTDSLGNTSNITTSTSGKLTVNIASVPVITLQPHDTAVNSGSSAGFLIVATGNGALKYQWRKNGGNISGATSATFFIPSAAITDTGSYSVAVTDSLGNTGVTITSNSAHLSVSAASVPVITSQPHDTSVTSGSPASFLVAATGNGALRYQWKKNGTVISGATSAIYTLPSAAITDTGSYSVVVTDSLGNTSAPLTSTSGRLMVNTASAPHITTQPHDTSVVSGSSAGFTVVATGNGLLKYQWMKGGNTISGATGSTYSIASAAITDTGSYSVVVTDSLGNTSAVATNTSGKLMVSTASAPVITTQPHDTSVVSGASAGFAVAATGNGLLKYQWKKNGSTLSGATGSTYSISSAAITDTGSYSVVVTDSLGNTATTTTSTSGKLTVNIASVPVITLQPHDTAVNSGSSAGYAITATGNGTLRYQWKKNGVVVSGATGATYSIPSVAVTDTGSYSGTVTDSLGNTAAITTSNAAHLSVNIASSSVVTTQPHNAAVNSGSSAGFTVVATGNGTLSYQWSKNGNVISGATGATYSIPSASITDTGFYAVGVTDSLGNTGATITSNAAHLTVNVASAPVITLQPHDTALTSGSAASFTVAATGNGTLKYQWNKNGGVIPGATSATYSISIAAMSDTGSYTVAVIDSLGNTGATTTSHIAHLAVNTTSAPVITLQPHDTTVMPGSAASFLVAATGNGTLSYQWKKNGVAISGATGATYSIPSVAVTDTGSYTVVVIDSLGNTGSTTTSNAARLLLSVASAPVITTQPLDTTVTSGSAVSFTVAASGNGTLKYQWKKNGGILSGATGTNFSIPSVAVTDTGSYSVVVTDSLGNTGATTVSNSARLSVNVASPPVITAQPHDSTVVSGAGASFSVAAIDIGALSYQWKKNGVAISGATSATYSIPSVAVTDTGSYSVMVTDSLGNTGASMTSNPARLFVNAASAPVISAQPHDTAVTSGMGVSFSVVSTGNGTLKYQWKKNGAVISGAKSATYSIPSVAVTDTGSYSVVVTDSLGNTVVTTTSNAAQLTVNAAGNPVITTQPHDIAVTSGMGASFTVAATGNGTLSYQWKKSGAVIAGATSSTYSIPSVAGTDSGSYSVVVLDSLGNTSALTTSNAAHLTVDIAGTPVVTTQPHDTTVASGSAASFTVAATGNGALSYQWKKNGAVISGATGSTYSIPGAAGTDSGSYSVVVTDSLGNTGVITTSAAAHLSVAIASAPVLITQPHDTTVTSGSPVNFSVTATGNGSLKYQWRKNGNALSGATGVTYSIPIAASADTGSYSVVVTDSLGNTVVTTTSNAAHLSVNTASAPVITTQPHDTVVTSGSAAGFTVVASGNGTLNYQWKKDGAVISGATNSTYSIPSTAGTDSGSYSVVVLDSLGNTSATTSAAAHLSVSTASAPILTTQPHDTTVVSGSSVSYSVTATGNGSLKYQWKKSGNTISGATGVTFSIASAAITDTGSYAVVVTDSLGNTGVITTSAAAHLSVNTATAPIISVQPHDTVVTSGAAASFTVAATGNGTLSYQWKKNGVTIPGATSATYSIPSVAINDTGSYNVAVSDNFGNTVATTPSNAAHLSVNVASAPVLTTVPHDTVVASGSAASFTVAATGNGTLKYQWKKNGSSISGATGVTYSIPSAASTDTDSYSVVVTDSLGNTGATTTSNAAHLLVNSAGIPVITTQPHDTSVTSGSAASFLVVASGNGILKNQWKKNGISISGATSTTFSIASVAVTDTGSYTLLVTDSLGNTVVSTLSNAAHLSVNTTTAPVITTQPHDTTVTSGAGASFSVAATGNGTLSYQWKKNGNALSGATGVTYSIPIAASADTGFYTMVVTNVLGNTSSTTTSTPGKLTVNSALVPVITTSPHDTTVNSGGSAGFTVVASGNGILKYQWRKNGTPVTGATNSSYSIPSAAVTDSGSYSVLVVDSLGNTISSTTSASGKLIVDAASFPIITLQPHDTGVASGAGASFTVIATGSGTLGYQWKKGNNAILGANSVTYSIASAAITDTGTYSVLVTDSLGNTSATTTSFSCRLIVNTASFAVITVQPRDTTVASGSGASFTVTAAGNGILRYQWRKGGNAIGGANSATYFIASAAFTDTGSYSVLITDSLGNTSTATTSASAKLTVNIASAPVITTPPHDTTVSSGSGAGFAVVATGNGTLRYQWKKNGSAITGATGSTYSIGSAAITDTGSYSVLVADSLGNTGFATTSSSARLTVNTTSVPVITAEPHDTTVNSGASAGFTVVASGNGILKYQWKKNGSTVAGATGSSYSIGSVAVTDTGSYSVLVTDSLGNTGTATISTSGRLTVNTAIAPIITLQPHDTTVNSGSSASFTIVATGNGTLKYQWMKSGASISGATNASYSISSVATTDTGSYSVLVTDSLGNTGSSLASASARLIVNTALTPVITTEPHDTSVNSGSAAGFAVIATGNGTLKYQWTKNGTNISGATNASYSITSVAITDTGAYGVLVKDSLGNTSSTLLSTFGRLTVNTALAPVITAQPHDTSVASGSSAGFTVLATGPGKLNYQWKKNGVVIPGATIASYTISSVAITDTGSYSAAIIDSLGNTGVTTSSVSARLTVATASAPSITTQPHDTTVVSGSAAGFSVVATGPGRLSYQWRKGGNNLSGATNFSYFISNATITDTGSYSALVTDSLGNTATSIASASGKLTVTTASAPVITTQPHDTTVISGSGASFSVVATGNGILKYQWMKNGVSLTGVNTTYVIPSVASTDTGSYSVLVTDSLGNSHASITSSSGRLIVNFPARIVTQPASQILNAGGTARFIVAASGTAPVAYKWLKNGTDSAGAGDTLTLSGVVASNAGTYKCVVSNIAGTDTSVSATLTVNTAPVVTSQPQSHSLNALGGAIKFGVSATGTLPLAYAWVHNHAAASDTVKRDTLTALTDTLFLASAALTDTGSYKCIVANVAGGVASSFATLSVGLPVIVSQPQGKSATMGTLVKLGVVVTGVPPLTYAWIHAHGTASDTLKRDTLTVLTDTLALSSVVLEDSGSYKCLVKNSGGGAASASAALTVILPAPTGLSYSKNPAVYIMGSAITPDTPAVTGFLIHFSSSPVLPAGLFIDSLSGILSGTPSVLASAVYTVSATNLSGSATTPLNLTVLTVPSGLSYSQKSPVYVLDSAITPDTPSVTGMLLTFSVNPALPTGLLMDSLTGLISGTPTAVFAVKNYQVTASNIAGSMPVTLTIQVLSSPPSGILSGNRNALVLRIARTSLSFNLPRGAATVGVSITDIWGRTAWASTLKTSEGAGGSYELSSGRSHGDGFGFSGVYIARLKLFDSSGKFLGLMEKRFSLISAP